MQMPATANNSKLKAEVLWAFANEQKQHENNNKSNNSYEYGAKSSIYLQVLTIARK